MTATDVARDPLWENTVAWLEKQLDPLALFARVQVRPPGTPHVLTWTEKIDDYGFASCVDSHELARLIEARKRGAFERAIREIDETLHA